MNVENARKLIDYLRALPRRRFQMGYFLALRWRDRDVRPCNTPSPNAVPYHDDPRTDCLTVACIAGHAVMCLGTEEDVQDYVARPVNAMAIASRLLDIDDDRARYLFLGGWCGGVDADVPPHYAASEIERMLS